MKRTKSKGKAPGIRLVAWQGGATAAVVVAGLAGSAAIAAPGDLDPSFGETGRKSGITLPWFGSLRTVEVQDDDAVIFGGGGEYDYYNYFDDFFGRLLPDGTLDAGFVPAALEQVALYDTALQSDGKLVGTGVVSQPDGRQKLVVFRLLSGGAIDAGFGLNGLVVVSDGSSNREAGYSVIVDPDDRIVVAGERGSNLLVARLLPDGAFDTSFGTGGIVTGLQVLGGTQRIARVPSGGYRVIGAFTSGMGYGCRVAGVTALGALDPAFGSGGYAYPPSGANGAATCTSLGVLSDGRVVVAGQDEIGESFADRMLLNGAADTGFDASLVASRFQWVSALGIGPTGKIFVAGTDQSGFSGAMVARLLADGALDTEYGRSGTTFVDPQVRLGQGAYVSDLQVADDHGLVVGGNYYSWLNGSEGFVARLQGDGAAGGPGVFSIIRPRILATEAGGSAVLSVRRSGGSTGAVAVTYTTSSFPWALSGGSTYAPGNSAATSDFTASTGRLTWADGDATEREIVVPIVADTTVEEPEWFAVELSAPEGGAGLGYQAAQVEIAGTSYPYGDLVIFAGSAAASEGTTAGFYVARNFYSQGAVSVTVRAAAAGTATPGDDFRNTTTTWQDVVVSWADGDAGAKYIPVQIVADGSAESAETLTLEIVSPTGGALLGTATQASVQIIAQSSPPPARDPPKSRNGGGSFGWLGAMLAGLAGALRRSRRPHEGATNA